MEFHTSWDQLEPKLLKEFPKGIVNGLRETEKTLVIEIEDLKYDPSIPILTEEALMRYYFPNNALPSYRLLPIEYNGTPSTSKQHSNVETDQEELCLSEDTQESVLSDKNGSTCSSSRMQLMGQCSTDALIIQEPIDDEYYKYKDDDSEVETKLSKNLKKIRSEKKQPAKPVVTEPVKKPPPPPTQLKPAPQQPPPPPPEPNWPETIKQLEANNLSIVFKDISYFKNKVKSNTVSQPIPKDLVMKCLIEDDTYILKEALELVFELDYSKDVDFWSELVLRIKRKISSHFSIRKFKSKLDPDVVCDNYRKCLVRLVEYASSPIDLTLRLPFHSWMFLQNSVQPPPPPPPVEGKKVKFENPICKLEPKNEKEVPPPAMEIPPPAMEVSPPSMRIPPPAMEVPPPVKVEPTLERQENIDPAEVKRRYTRTKNIHGQEVFMVEKPRAKTSNKTFKKGL